MISLAKAKEIIGRADSAANSDLEYSKIDADAVYSEGWEHLGDDYFYSERANLIAGPSGGGPERTMISPDEAVLNEYKESEKDYDISFEWDRQVGEESVPYAARDRNRLIPLGAEEAKRPNAGGKCTCDT